LNKKILLSIVAALFVVSFLAVPVFAAGTLTPHASIEGRAMVKTAGKWSRGDAVMTFIQYTPGEGSPGGHAAGWAITLTVNEETYVWHVTDIKACGKSSIVIIEADPHPLAGAMPGPSSIRIVLNHDAGKPLVVATGHKVFFIGKTLA
jgi:hypothetical protein